MPSRLATVTAAVALVLTLPAGVASAVTARSASPSVSSVSPAAGPLGGGVTVTVHGTHFRRGAAVTFGNAAATRVRVVSSTTITVTTPRHAAGRADLRVTSDGARSAKTTHDHFTYVTRPHVATVRLVKGSGLGGSTVRVTGPGINAATRVRFGTSTARTLSRKGDTLLVAVPQHAPGRLHVTVSTAGGTSPAGPTDVYPMPTPAQQSWRRQTDLDLTSGQLSDVSCPTTSVCFASDRTASVFTITDGRWSAPSHLPGWPYPALPDQISCPTVDFCAVAGGHYVYVRGDDGVWRTGPLLSSDGGRPSSISCTTAGNCLALEGDGYLVMRDGSWSDLEPIPSSAFSIDRVACFGDLHCFGAGQNQDGDPGLFEFDGTAWTTVPFGGDGQLTKISCASSTLCALQVSGGRVSTWDGTSWTTPSIVDTAPDWADDARLDCVGTACVYDGTGSVYTFDGDAWTRDTTSATYDLVGCATATQCVGEDNLGHIGSFDGRSWTTTSTQLATVGPSSSIDCASPTFCAMTDMDGNAYTYDGSAWSDSSRVTDTYYKASSVSCPSTSFCLAVYGNRVTATLTGGRWSLVHAPQSVETSVSCTSPTWCLAAGRTDSELFDGTSWHVVSKATYLSLSCASSTVCAAATPTGTQTFDGTRWHEGIADDTIRNVGPHSVSCPTTTFCLVLDGVGREIDYRDGMWSQPSPTLADGPLVLSCFSATFCESVGSGATQTFDGHNWSAVNTQLGDEGFFDLTALACDAPQRCLDAQGATIFASRPA